MCHRCGPKKQKKKRFSFAKWYDLWHIHVKLKQSLKIYYMFISTYVYSRSIKKCMGKINITLTVLRRERGKWMTERYPGCWGAGCATRMLILLFSRYFCMRYFVHKQFFFFFRLVPVNFGNFFFFFFFTFFFYFVLFFFFPLVFFFFVIWGILPTLRI